MLSSTWNASSPGDQAALSVRLSPNSLSRAPILRSLSHSTSMPLKNSMFLLDLTCHLRTSGFVRCSSHPSTMEGLAQSGGKKMMEVASLSNALLQISGVFHFSGKYSIASGDWSNAIMSSFLLGRATSLIACQSSSTAVVMSSFVRSLEGTNVIELGLCFTAAQHTSLVLRA